MCTFLHFSLFYPLKFSLVPPFPPPPKKICMLVPPLHNQVFAVMLVIMKPELKNQFSLTFISDHGVCYKIGELLIFDLQKISALFQSCLYPAFIIFGNIVTFHITCHYARSVVIPEYFTHRFVHVWNSWWKLEVVDSPDKFQASLHLTTTDPVSCQFVCLDFATLTAAFFLLYQQPHAHQCPDIRITCFYGSFVISNKPKIICLLLSVHSVTLSFGHGTIRGELYYLPTNYNPDILYPMHWLHLEQISTAREDTMYFPQCNSSNTIFCASCLMSSAN